MREILFRGKTKVHNKWVYGWYCGKTLSQDMSRTEESSQIIDAKTLYWHTCEAETVGQFTGLTDKNGKKIFEGDIIKDDWGKIYKVFYSLQSCSFMVECTKAKSEYETGNYRIGSAWTNTIQVIGNIHDNPELLEVYHD